MVLEKLKETLKKRIEKNCFKQELTYVDKNRESHTELVYLKRGKGKYDNWHEIHSPVDEATNKWNLPNAIFGGTGNLLKFLFIMFCLAGLFVFTITVIGDAKEYMNGNEYVITKIADFKEFCMSQSSDIPIVRGNLSALNLR